MNPFRSLFLSLSRMPPILMLFIILGLAVVVTMLVMGRMQESEQKFAQKEQALLAESQKKTMCVYAAKDIAQGEEISSDAVEEKEIPFGQMPQGGCASKNECVGRKAAVPITVGSAVMTQLLQTGGMVISGFEGKIKEGMRALTFAVDTNSGVAGFIAPGSHVDVIAITGQGAETEAAPVMSDVEVIAVGTTYQKAPGATTANPAGSVTVTVTPEDAQKLIRAISAAKLYLTLRNNDDHTPVVVSDVSKLFPKPEPKVEEVAALPPPSLPAPPGPGGDAGGAGAIPPPAPPPMHEIELWSGSKKEVLSVPQG